MIIIHGEDTHKSYDRLTEITSELKTNEVEVIYQDSSEVEITYLRQEIGSSGLFGTNKCFVIKNFLSSTKSKNKDKIFDVLNQETSHEIILWESKGVSATILKKFPKAKTESFSIPPIIFKFLDTLRPGNTKSILLSWKKILDEGTEPEFVFAMLSRQVRLLIQAKSGANLLKLAPYPLRLITTQASCFSLEHLLDLHQLLYQIDIKIKTGTSTVTIDHLLGHFLQKI